MSKLKKSRLPPFPIFYSILILSSTIPGNESCSFRRAGENAGQKAAEALAKATRESSEQISKALENSVRQLDSSLKAAVSALEKSAGELSKSIDNGAKELGSSIRKVSGDLVKISEKVTNSIDKGVEEMSKVMREAIDATKEISQTLSNSVDKAVAEIGKQIEHATDKIQEIVKNLTNSLDNAVDKLAETLRHVADSFVKISEQFNLRIDSGDVVELGKEMKEGLVQSISELTTNWEMAVNTADLKDVGASAAAELGRAMQNINAKVVVRLEMDDNSRLAIKDISIAVGIAFSVLFVAIVVALKSCRSCVVKSFTAISDQCKSGDVEAGPGEENGVEMKPMKKREKTKNPSIKKHEKVNFSRGDNDSFTSSTDYNTDEGNTNDNEEIREKRKKKKAFDKRLTKSYTDYNDFPKIKNKWEKRENRAVRQAAQSSKRDKLLSPD